MTLDRPQQAHLGAVLLLVCASLFCAYRWHYSQVAHASTGLATLAEMLRIETDSATRLRPQTGGTEGATMPELLSRIQEAASARNIAIRSVSPSPADAQKISLGVHGDFRDLMAFFGRLETYQVAVNGFDFAPDEGGVAGTIELAHSGKPGAPKSFADYLDALVSYSAVRDPFEIGDPVPLPNAGSDLGDLSWTYHLTSISLFGAERVATVDGKDYRIGDHLGSLQVVAIGPSSVSLTAPHQPLVQKLHFRRNPGGGSHAD